MRLREFLLALPLVLVAPGAGAQQGQDDPSGQQVDPSGQQVDPSGQQVDPQFAGRVFDSPVPVPKVEAADEVPAGDDPARDDPLTDDPARDDPAADTGDVAASEPSTEALGPGDSERSLPVVLRPGEDPTRDLDAGGRIKSVPDPEGATEGREGERFVRAPDRTYEVETDSSGAPIATPDTGLRAGARLRELDKMTGTIETFEIEVGQTLDVARLRIKLEACRSPSDNDTHGTMAFLKIWDTKNEGADPAFTGWMFAESPALSALDHPRYDLWVINCTTVAGGTSAGNE